jgi:hypothetical protein
MKSRFDPSDDKAPISSDKSHNCRKISPTRTARRSSETEAPRSPMFGNFHRVWPLFGSEGTYPPFLNHGEGCLQSCCRLGTPRACSATCGWHITTKNNRIKVLKTHTGLSVISFGILNKWERKLTGCHRDPRQLSVCRALDYFGMN